MWNDLTQSQKDEIISMAAQSGVSNIDDIMELYNSSSSGLPSVEQLKPTEFEEKESMIVQEQINANNKPLPDHTYMIRSEDISQNKNIQLALNYLNKFSGGKANPVNVNGEPIPTEDWDLQAAQQQQSLQEVPEKYRQYINQDAMANPEGYANGGNLFAEKGVLEENPDDEFQYYGTTLPTVPVYPEGTVMYDGVGYNLNGEESGNNLFAENGQLNGDPTNNTNETTDNNSWFGGFWDAVSPYVKGGLGAATALMFPSESAQYIANRNRVNEERQNELDAQAKQDALTRFESQRWVDNNKNNYERTLNNVVNFERAFEGYIPEAKKILDSNGKTSTITAGYGNTVYVNDDGTVRPLKLGEKWSEELSAEQQRRYLEKVAVPAAKNVLGLKNFDSYPEELKFQLLDALFNVGATKIRDNAENYMGALKEYESSKGYLNPNYDLNKIMQHADWNLNTKTEKGTPSSIAVRAIYRQYPQFINYDNLQYALKKDKWQELYDAQKEIIRKNIKKN